MRKVLLPLLFLVVLSVFQMENVYGQTNRALEAAVTTSFVSGWETLEAVNDGVGSINSVTKPAEGAYGNWNGEAFYDTYNWVQYQWDERINITSTAVYWWTDNGGILQPTDAYIEYWNGLTWVNAGQIGKNLNQFNSLAIDKWADKIRVYMKSSAATGIIEWRVMGTDESPCDGPEIITTASLNGAEADTVSNVVAVVGDTVKIVAKAAGEGLLYWFGPNGYNVSGDTVVSLENVQLNQSGTFSIVYVTDCGGISEAHVNLTVKSSNDGAAYVWPAYNPPIYYDFKDEYPNVTEPTQDLDDCEGVAGRVSSGWWTFVWGDDARSEVTEAAITPMLEQFNEDFAYMRDTMGWPPDKRAKNGYRSAIYLYGSNLCTDNAPNTALGGWMGAINYQGESWPMVLASYYPVYAFDPSFPHDDAAYQMGGMIHEGIHSILADMPGARNAGWFHEGGNTWLQQEMEARRQNDYSSMGFLNSAAMLAPFMPIECYSGWLQDGSFGGPTAEGVNMFEGDQQICTWRTLLGGTQYGNMFPVIFSQIFGDHSVAWIWRYCENTVLEGVGDTLGDYQTRRLIMEYRAKQTLVDLGKWTGATRKLLDDRFGLEVKAEWEPSWMSPEAWNATPYAMTYDNGTGLITPENRTTPGWSGANQIPLIVDGAKVTVDFIPIGRNMSCQLVYRATDGTTVYGEPVLGGECSLVLDKPAANNVVFAVVCNTDYVYEGEETRKAHFDYRIQLVEGVKERGHQDVRWYQWENTLTNLPLQAAIADFDADQTIVNTATPVTFTDKSEVGVTQWFWDFGDGNTSTDQNPSHTYDSSGTFTVTLIASGFGGIDTLIKTDYIAVTHAAPDCFFSADTTVIVRDSILNFTDETQYHVDSWAWDFGDANTSTEQNPSHTYTQVGTYTVSLHVSGYGGIDSMTRVNYITVVYPAPVAEFSASDSSIVLGDSIVFSDLSENDVTQWLWDFGDGNTSTEQSPQHIYADGGTFSVSLTVTGNGGTDEQTKTDFIVVNHPVPVADFSADQTDAQTTTLIQFTDESEHKVTEWSWDFGDGNTSMEQNPTHIYEDAGVFTVTLIAVGPGGRDTVTKADFITVVYAAPVADFSVDETDVEVNTTVQFTDESENKVTEWLWDFGDGNSSLEQHPNYLFADSGTYTISLIAIGPGGRDTISKVDYITVTSPVGVEENERAQGVLIYPNPVKNICTILFKEKTSSHTDIRITNALGQEVIAQLNVKGEQHDIDVSTLVPGLYYITIQSGSSTYTQSITIAR